jgi:hypothetical protein
MVDAMIDALFPYTQRCERARIANPSIG